MIPILFAENATTYTTNGIGRLKDAISCICTEERNGIYEVELVYPIDGQHFNDININSIIVVIPCDGGTRQAFRVYQISKPINGKTTINARHISYQLNSIPTMPFTVTASPTACADTLAALKDNAVESCPFTFWTDLTTAAGYAQVLPASIRSRLGGVEGSVLDQFGGEYEWDNFDVKLHHQRGRINTGITLRYGKNITDITQEENIASTITGVVPYWSDLEGENVVTLPEKVVYSQYADRYPFHLTEVLDLSGKWQEPPTEASLRLAAQAYVNKTGLGLPKVNIKVSFVALWQTEEYKNIAPLQRVKLCDEVTVEFEKLGISETAKVVRTEYDVLMNRYRSIQIGSLRSTLITTLNDQNAATLQTIEDNRIATIDAVNNATAWLTSANGYVVAIRNQDGSWKELLFMDTNDPATARNGIRINNHGIGLWNYSRDGGNVLDGPYTNAWTIDGNLIADFITTGILKDKLNKFVLNLDNGTLTLSTGTNVGNETLGGMQGRITANETGISSEYTRATTAEGTLSSRITQTADAISSEVTRASTAEGNLSSRITQTADAITSEVTRATTAEGTLSSRITQTDSAITSEVTRATTAEGTLSSRITQTETSLTTKVSRSDVEGIVESEIEQQADSIRLKAAAIVVDSNNLKIDQYGTTQIYDNATLKCQLDNNGLMTYGKNRGESVEYIGKFAFSGYTRPNTTSGNYYISNGIVFYRQSDSYPFAIIGLGNSGNSDSPELRIRNEQNRILIQSGSDLISINHNNAGGINISSDDNIEIAGGSLDINVSSRDVNVNGTPAYTGEINGISFINGLCVG